MEPKILRLVYFHFCDVVKGHSDDHFILISYCELENFMVFSISMKDLFLIFILQSFSSEDVNVKCASQWPLSSELAKIII